MTGALLAIVGLVLLIAGGSYAIYERYVAHSARLSQLAVNPVVLGLGIIGVILLVVGTSMYYRTKAATGKTASKKNIDATSSGQSTSKGSNEQKPGQ